jgi:sugar (pentulose or hexulose) kinase
MYTLAIDLGTQSVRAAVVAQDGDILGVEQTQQDVDSPHPGWAQQRPDSWWEIARRAIRDIIA